MVNSFRSSAVLFTFGVILAMIAVTLQFVFPFFRSIWFIFPSGGLSSLLTTVGLIGMALNTPNY